MNSFQPSYQRQPLEPPTSESDCTLLPRCLKCGRSRPAVSFCKGRNVCNSCRHKMRRTPKRRNVQNEQRYGVTYRQKYPWRTLLMHARKRAAKFNLAYDLEDHIDEMKTRIMAMRCEMTGVGLIPGSGCGSQGKRCWNTVSLDRKDSQLGYTLQNVRIVCWAMNAAMGTWGESVLRDLLTAWATSKGI